jgi:hypothetical protein
MTGADPRKKHAAMSTPLPVTVEITIPELIQGVFSIEGTLQYAVDTLTFDYQARDMRGRTVLEESILLPLDQVRTVERKRGFRGAKVVVHPKQLVTFEFVAGAARHAFVFQVKHTHRKAAARFVAEVRRAHAALGADGVDRIPFKVPSANLGVTEIDGLVYLDDVFLILEVASGISGGVRKEQQVIEVDPRALDDIWFKQGVVRDRLILKPTKRDLFRVMPGMYRGKETLTLSLKTVYRTAAEHLVGEVTRRRQA